MDLFSHDYDLPEGLDERLELVARRILFTRKYTLRLLEGLSDEEWFWQPEAYPTHIAWQVGHIAMSHYGLTLFRIRGRETVDRALLPGKYRKLFLKGTRADAEPTAYPQPQELLEKLEQIRLQTFSELAGFAAMLDEPTEAPHTSFGTKFGSLVFVADHEMLHAGQIGMLRRLMGKEPVG